jgi:hypothetical protein
VLDNLQTNKLILNTGKIDRLCGLVFIVPGYRSRGPRFDSWRYQILWVVVGLEQGPLSLMSITEELLEKKSNGSGSRKPRLMAGDLFRCPRDTLYPQKLALISPTSGGPSVGIVCLRAETIEFFFLFSFYG